MCGRYWIDPETGAPDGEIWGMKLSGEVLPGDTVAAVCFSRAGNIKSFPMQWGWDMNGGKKLINTRSETAEEKQMFVDSYTHRRCLLPMSAYFEWHKRGRDKIKYRIAPEREGTYYLAGLYRWEEKKPVFTVLTMDASEEIEFIHPRMPVIVEKENAEAWLSGKCAFATKTLMDYQLAI